MTVQEQTKKKEREEVRLPPPIPSDHHRSENRLINDQTARFMPGAFRVVNNMMIVLMAAVKTINSNWRSRVRCCQLEMFSMFFSSMRVQLRDGREGEEKKGAYSQVLCE